MTSGQAPDAWGIHASWTDALGEIREVPSQTIEQLRVLAGRPPADHDATAPIVTRRGRRLDDGGDVTCEDGSRQTLGEVVPDDFPFGYHRMRHADGRDRALIVSPGRCWQPGDWMAWGWTVQLYAARSSGSWGIGDLRDLRRIREWSQRLGAEFLLINPLHAAAPTYPQEDSPYLPTSRRFRNPLYLCVEECVGARLVDLTPYARDGHALNTNPLIDRDAIAKLKREALVAVYDEWCGLDAARDQAETVEERAAFESWRAHQGQPLDDFATWMVLAAEHGHDWRRWPEPLRDPGGQAVRAFADQRSRAVDFEAWLQWQLDTQLRHAGEGFCVIQDLPVGVDGGGADAWVWQDAIATGVSVGAPPDLFSSRGQTWGSPPVVPWRLRGADYEPFIQSVRATIEHTGGLRVDHVMGLFRLWWVPPDSEPSTGAYIRYPSDDLLDIVALESHRERAIVVGEDLGTVESGVRESLAERAILSYRLLLFDRDPPPTWPLSSLGAVTTHDLPTLAGVWSGADVKDRAAHTGEDLAVLREQQDELMARLRDVAEPGEGGVVSVVVAAHHALAAAPCVVVTATLDDAAGAVRRPNMPGAAARPNWRIPLPVLLDDLEGNDLTVKIANVLKRPE